MSRSRHRPATTEQLRLGNGASRLVVLRGNSGSGKSTTAQELRRRIGRGVAWVEQDYLRRTLLREHARAAAPNIGLIEQTARYALEHGYHVILEGGLYGPHYGVMLRQLIADHAGVSGVYYFQLSFDETIRRQVIDESSSLDETADRIITDLTWTTGGTTPHPLEG